MATTPQPKTSSYSTDQAPPRPQQAPSRGRKISEYGRQLAEKQKARNEYGLREAAFRRYFMRAAKSSLAIPDFPGTCPGPKEQSENQWISAEP